MNHVYDLYEYVDHDARLRVGARTHTQRLAMMQQSWLVWWY